GKNRSKITEPSVTNVSARHDFSIKETMEFQYDPSKIPDTQQDS
ncbi:15854_t:CDS:2, partial [Acaulospora morrowiae]